MTLTRRALGAWAVPVVLVAAASPAFAASAPVTVTGWADKCPGTSDVPGGFPKHGYRLVLTVSGDPSRVVVTEVVLGNGKRAQVLTQPVRTSSGWEAVVDADSSPSTLTVTAVVDGQTVTAHLDAYPHCTGGIP